MRYLVAAWLQVMVLSGAGAAQEDLTGWKLMWSDEFDGRSVDSKKWLPCERGKSDWNDTMTADPKCYALRNGVLELRGFVNRDRAKDPSEYLTGGLTSQGKFDFTYGKVVIRAKFKSARGAWPALWMLGAKGGWPHGGEIDLMEHLNFDDKVYQTVHSNWANNVDKAKTIPKGTTAPIKRDEFNEYGVEWDEEKLVFTVNGGRTLTYPRVPEKGAEQWPFNQPFYFILSMQIGGNWVGKPDPKDYPASMTVDWVRVYQRDPAAKVK